MKNDKHKIKLDYVQGGSNEQVSDKVKVNVDVSYDHHENLKYGGPNPVENESNNTFNFNSTNYKPQCK